MKARDGFILRDLAGEYVLAPVGKKMKSFQGIALLNELSVFIWKCLQRDTSRQDLLNSILDEYNVDEATAAADLDEILSRMIAYDLIDV